MKEFHMARTVITKVTDDLTGDIINGRVVERSIVIDGVPYLLELSEDSSRQLDEDLEPWVDAGKKAGVARKSNGRRNSDASNIRSWANANGRPLGTRGRIPFEVIEAYRAAH
jgi:hypothetical protein